MTKMNALTNLPPIVVFQLLPSFSTQNRRHYWGIRWVNFYSAAIQTNILAPLQLLRHDKMRSSSTDCQWKLSKLKRADHDLKVRAGDID
jgi:hypothetical protein